MVLEALIGSFGGSAMENAYARFVQEKMPAVWERFLHEAQ